MAEFKWPQEGAAGSGDVVGPASSTDNALARFDGTTGKLLQNSSVTVSDAGVVAGATIDGDDNTVQDLPLSALKTSLADATEVLRRDASGVVVSGPMTVTAAGDTNGIKTIDLRNDDDLTADNTWMMRIENRNDTATSHPHIEMRRGRAANANLSNGDIIGGADFHPRHNASSLSAAKFEVIYTGDGTTRLADWVWYTSNAGAPAERMRLKANGDLNLSGLTASRVVVTDADKDLVSSAVTDTELGYVSGVTSAIQTQIDGKQPLDADLTALAGISSNGLLARTGAGTAAARSVAAGSSKVSVTNGDGVAGNPTIDVTEANLTLGNIGGTLGIAKGGTGQTTATAAFDALAPTTTLGDTVYHDGTDNVRLAGNTTTTRKFLRQTGNGSASAAPAWDTLEAGDLPAASSSAAGSVTREYTGTFTGTLTGVSGTVTDGIRYNVVGKTAHIQFTSLLSGTSNSTSMTVTGLPAGITPARNQVILCFILDDSSGGLGRVTISTSGVMTFDRFSAINNITSFTASGLKGVPQQTFTFSLE